MLASPVCLDFIADSRWLAVGLDSGTVMVSHVYCLCCVNYEIFTLAG